MIDKAYIELIETTSGDGCFDTVSSSYAGYSVDSVKQQWVSLWIAATSIGESWIPKNKVNILPFEICVVRTPRAYPYNFKMGNKRYVIIDEHLDRVVHRWARLTELVERGAVDLDPHFDELYAERAHVLGQLPLSALYMASSYVRTQDLGTLSQLDEPGAESRFQSRSLAGRMFIIGHELAHVFLEEIPTEIVMQLQRRLRDLCHAGANEKALGSPENSLDALMNRMMTSRTLMTECLCDALGLASLVNIGFPWDTSLVAAADSLYLLQTLKGCDRVLASLIARMSSGMNPSESHCSEDNDGGQDIERDFYTREVVLILVSNLLKKFLMQWGASGLAARIESYVTSRERFRRKMRNEFFRFEPGMAYRARISAPGFLPTRFDDFVRSATVDFKANRKLIGFDQPINYIETHSSVEARMRDFEVLRSSYSNPFPLSPFKID